MSSIYDSSSVMYEFCGKRYMISVNICEERAKNCVNFISKKLATQIHFPVSVMASACGQKTGLLFVFKQGI